MYLVLALALAVDWITPPDPRLPVHGLPWYAENSGEAIRLPQRLKASLPPAVWNLGLSPSGGRLRFRTGSTRWGRRQVQILNRHDDCCFGERQHDAAISGLACEPAYRIYEKAVQQALGAHGEFHLEIDDSAPHHMISPATVKAIVNQIKR